MNKRGQITVFVIIGVMLFSVIAFTLFVTGIYSRLKVQSQADAIVRNVLASSPVEFRVQSCLDDQVRDALLVSGLQGGRIYVSQGGIHQLGEHIKIDDNSPYDTDANVSYGIGEHVFGETVCPNVPGYPAFNRRLVLGGEVVFSPGCFGLDNLPPLCEIDGPNKPTGGFFGAGALSCGDENYGLNSIQKTMQAYVASHLADCVNVSFVGDYLGYDIEDGEVRPEDVEILIQDTYLQASVDYPLNITIGNSEPVVRRVTFKKNVDSRIKQTYSFVRQFIQGDGLVPGGDWNSVVFNKTHPKPTILEAWRPGEEVVIFEEGFDDVVRIINNNDLALGSPYIFQFAIKNRIPVLDWIHTAQEIYPDIVVMEGNWINLSVAAFDPDEGDFLGFDASGWMFDYYDIFNMDCALSSNTPELCVAKGNSIDSWAWDFSRLQNWLLLYDFYHPVLNLSYKTRKHSESSGGDLGLHNFTIKVCDEEDRCDYQNVFTLVVDQPVAVITGSNNFSDIENQNIASKEDIYILNGSESSGIICWPLNYTWEDQLEEFFFSTEGNPIAVIPPIKKSREGEVEQIDFSIIETLPFKTASPRKIFLTVDCKYANDTDFMDVYVEDCLHHRSNTASYPFNEFAYDDGYYPEYEDDSNFYQADHTCCENYEIVSEKDEKTCYEYVAYGTWNYFNQISVQNAFNNDVIKSIQKNGEWNNEDHLIRNDVFERTFTTKCDGTRGNICKGDSEDNLEVFEECSDNGVDGVCSGPPSDMYEKGRTPDEIGCVNYEDETFEYVFHLSESKLCNEDFACSSYNIYGAENGNWWAQATCDGRGGCTKTYDKECNSDECGTDDVCDGLPDNRCNKIGNLGYFCEDCMSQNYIYLDAYTSASNYGEVCECVVGEVLDNDVCSEEGDEDCDTYWDCKDVEDCAESFEIGPNNVPCCVDDQQCSESDILPDSDCNKNKYECDCPFVSDMVTIDMEGKSSSGEIKFCLDDSSNAIQRKYKFTGLVNEESYEIEINSEQNCFGKVGKVGDFGLEDYKQINEYVKMDLNPVNNEIYIGFRRDITKECGLTLTLTKK